MSVIERSSPVDASAYAQAVLNMLEDLSSERERMEGAQSAMLNILEDFDAERTRLQQGHVAMLNILEDASAEKHKVEDTQHAILNILEDLAEERREIARINEQLEDRVRQRTQELERSNRSLASFTYTVAHDLRAPLRGMSGFAGALLDEYGDHLDDTGRDYAQRIRNASARMGKLIEDLLLLARVSRAELHRERVDLSALVAETVVELRRQHPDREAEFRVEDGITAWVDRVLFRTVLQNLLENAWKFTARNQNARIEFAAIGAEADEVGVCVRDNGAGFDPAHVGELFEPFQSLHSADEYPGTGVGLASVRQVVELHGGRVWAEGAIGKGAAFYIVLPDLGANHGLQRERTKA